jgi:hypothetical protein
VGGFFEIWQLLSRDVAWLLCTLSGIWGTGESGGVANVRNVENGLMRRIIEMVGEKEKNMIVLIQDNKYDEWSKYGAISIVCVMCSIQ